MAFLRLLSWLHPRPTILNTGRRWIGPGQTARFEVAGIGVLEQRVVAAPGVVNSVRNGMEGRLKAPAG